MEHNKDECSNNDNINLSGHRSANDLKRKTRKNSIEMDNLVCLLKIYK